MAILIRNGIEIALQELQETIVRIRKQLSPKDEAQTDLEELRAEAEKIEQVARVFRERSKHP